MGSPFKGSNHVKPPDRKGPCNGDCLEGGGWHVALICKELATGATLDQVPCVCPGCWPIESCVEGLAYKGPSCGVMTAESGVNFCQKIPPFLFGDAPLKESSSAFLVQFSLMDPVGLGSPHYAACLILVLQKFLSS